MGRVWEGRGLGIHPGGDPRGMTGSARSAGRMMRGTMITKRKLLQTYTYSLVVYIERLIEKDLYTYSYRQFLSRYSFFNSEGWVRGGEGVVGSVAGAERGG